MKNRRLEDVSLDDVPFLDAIFLDWKDIEVLAVLSEQEQGRYRETLIETGSREAARKKVQN